MPPEENIATPTLQPPAKEPEPDNGLPKIRTFKTDASAYVHENKMSDLERATKSYVARGSSVESAPKVNYKKTFIIAGGLSVLALASFIGYGFLSSGLNKSEPTVQGPKSPPKFIETESETDITYIKSNQGSLTAAIKAELGKQLRFGTANNLRIKLDSNFINAGAFISALGWAAPKDFTDSLAEDFNLIAVYQSPATSPVFIFKSKDFIKTFSSLLAWEPNMWQDIKPFLDLSSIDVKTFYQLPFTDDSIKNNDARAFISADGKFLFEYAFFSKKFVIISTSRNALELVLARFIALPPQ